ncbi:MAG TPA: PD-(D/E)XK nuclease family protein, partial [Candidatus Tenderia electrophaga]|nr:PD-(D/E)XK nuclease family protein [Candidatus Tenderia electrophaga]
MELPCPEMERILSDLMKKLAAGSTVLTVNSRLALHLHKDYQAWQQQQGQRCWPTPQIIPWNNWLQLQWQECEFLRGGELPLMLAAEQCQTVWEAIIQSSPEVLLNIPATARSAMQAWRVLQQWNLPLEVLVDDDNPDSRAFYGWAMAFQQRCQQRHWLDEASLPSWLCQAMQAGELPLPGHVLLMGFDELTPQHRAVIEVMQGQGVEVESLEPAAAERSGVSLLSCADSLSEIRQVALWLRYWLARDETAAIGVVVPDLSDLRDDIERIFDEVLLPGAVLDLEQKPLRPYNISLGQPMAQLPLIYSALNLLSALHGSTSLASWSRLLLSPYLGGADQELSLRAQLDAALR